MENKNNNDYKQVVLKRAILLCWILLITCFIIKICGSNLFVIVCENEKIIKVCNFIDNSIIKYIVYLFSFLLSSYLVLKIVNPYIRLKSLKSILFIVCCILVWVLKLLLELEIIKLNILFVNIFDIVILYILLLAVTKKPLLLLFAVVLLFVFTFISSFTKGIGINGAITDSYIIAQIFFIDYYIMLALSVLYSKKIQNKRR